MYIKHVVCRTSNNTYTYTIDYTVTSMFGTPASFLDDDTATHDIFTTNS